MIESVDEFIRLRTSDEPAEYSCAEREPAPREALVDGHAEMRFWVAQNKTEPLVIGKIAWLTKQPRCALQLTNPRGARATPQCVIVGTRTDASYICPSALSRRLIALARSFHHGFCARRTMVRAIRRCEKHRLHWHNLSIVP